MVDDSETIRQMVRQALTAIGYQVLEAVDGLDGLEKIRSISDLSLVVCDVNMPRMTGLEMIAKVREEGLTTPILMLTSEGQPSLVKRGREMGAKGWLVKPFKVDLLQAAVNKLTAGPVAELAVAK